MLYIHFKWFRMKKSRTCILLIQCRDEMGILANTCQFLAEHNGNIVSLQEFADRTTKQFFARIEWELEGFSIPDQQVLEAKFQEKIGKKYDMNARFYFSDTPTKTCVFVSKYSHCLEDLLYRFHNDELNISIECIISNHETLKEVARQHSVPFHFLPVTKENKAKQEQQQRELIEGFGCELILLARYMQILSPSFVQAYANRIINIHHSFLPAFTGARPYHAAYTRGVKIIGATAHFVTSELDEGPIICQDITKVTHRDTVQEMIAKGRDTEKQMFSKAARLFSEHKLLANGNRTIVFD